MTADDEAIQEAGRDYAASVEALRVSIGDSTNVGLTFGAAANVVASLARKGWFIEKESS